MNIRVPSNSTLKKYGLTAKEWLDIVHEQGDCCPICKRVPPSGSLVTDHFHVRGFKKMIPEEKKKYLRGITCGHCNRFYLAKGITVEKAKNLVLYLQRYEERKSK